MFEICQNKQVWNKFLNEKIENPYFTQLYEWMEILSATFSNLKMYPLVLIENNEIKDIIPLIYDKNKKILFSPSPFGGIGGLSNPDNYPLLIKTLKNSFLKREKIYLIEISTFQKLPPSLFKFKGSNILLQVILDSNYLSGEEYTKRDFRRNLRKAKKMGVYTKISQPKDFKKFYQLYYQAMVRKNAKYIFPQEFFENIFRFFKDYLIFWECYSKENILLGYNLAFKFKESISTFFTISDFRYFKFFPATVLFCEMLNYAIKNNLKLVDYGASSPGDGTFEFKIRAGGRPIFYYHYFYPLSKAGWIICYKRQLRLFISRIKNKILRK